MFPNGAVYTPTATVYGVFNTFDADGAPITLAGSPTLRLERNRAGTWSELVTTGITLAVDEDDTGRHEYILDLDGLSSAAEAGDVYRVAINVGTVDTFSAVGIEVGHFFVEADGLTSQQKADVEAEAEDAIEGHFGASIDDDINDGSATTTSFTVTTSQGAKVLYGTLRLTSGALSGEKRVVKWTGTTVTVLGDDDMDAAEREFSAAPADDVTFTFTPGV